MIQNFLCETWTQQASCLYVNFCNRIFDVNCLCVSFVGYCDSASTHTDIDINLRLAAITNNTRAVKCLIEEKNAGVNVAGSDGKTALILASYGGHLEIVEYLIKMGASVDVKDSKGQTAFYLASSMGHLEVAKVLAGNGAYIEAKNNDGKSPIRIARENGHVEVVQFFVKQLGVPLSKFKLL